MLMIFLRWLIDTDQDAAGMRVIVDLHGGDPNDSLAQAEFREIKEKVISEVSLLVVPIEPQLNPLSLIQRELGEGRSYATMWRKYKRRVLLAMSSQAFAQLVCCGPPLYVKVYVLMTSRMALMVCIVSL